MKKTDIRSLINAQTKRRIEERGYKNNIPDCFKVSSETGCIKYITKQGQVRLDIDFDSFKELFETALWNYCLLEMQQQDDLMAQTPERIRTALKLYKCSQKTIETCEALKLVSPMFDNREKPR